MQAEPMDIGVAARRLGVSAATLRLYERRGLMPRAARTANGYRKYTQADLERARMVRRARRAGLTLKQIACLFERDDGGAVLIPLLRDQLGAVEREVRRLQRVRRYLCLWLKRREPALRNGA
jgi:DNA-binding transcriptional MerR regulator